MPVSETTRRAGQRNFTEIVVELPLNDADIKIVFPGGEEIVIQARPSNADVNYNGSLDIILPENTAVTNWAGDDMRPSESVSNRPEIRFAKQLVTELPGEYWRKLPS